MSIHTWSVQKNWLKSNSEAFWLDIAGSLAADTETFDELFWLSADSLGPA